MPASSAAVRPGPGKKKGAPARPPTSAGRRWFKRLALAVLILGLAGVGSVAGIFIYYDRDLPPISKVSDYKPPVVSRVVDRNGELIGEMYDERRTLVPRDKIPDVMIHALVDAEDAQFYEHKGLSYLGMLRALIYSVRPGARAQGASTLTQQLTRTYLLKTNERTLKRKVQEMILARRLENKLTKDEILYIYLNQIYFGHHRYGVEEAARFYFDKSISDVNAGEAALLASLPKGPEVISPIHHPERAKDRQRYVLSQMLRYGHITKEDAEKFAKAPIQLVRPAQTVGVAPEFVDEARRKMGQFGEDLNRMGKEITTTCDSRLQKLTREALERGLEALDDRQGFKKPQTHLKVVTPAAIRALLEERSLRLLHAVVEKPKPEQRKGRLAARSLALSLGRPVEGVVVEVRTTGKEMGVVVDTGEPSADTADLLRRLWEKRQKKPEKATALRPEDEESSTGGEPDEIDAATVAAPKVDAPPPLVHRAFLPLPAQKDRYNPKALTVDKRFSVGDVIWIRREPSLGHTSDKMPIAMPEFGPQAAVVAIDPTTREVRAMVGGYGFHAGGLNRARSHRQPGSAFKPFLYALAFQSGQFTAATVLNDTPTVIERDGLPPWIPKNAESNDFLGPIRLRVALAKSRNTIAAQLVNMLGTKPLIKLANDLGIETTLDEKGRPVALTEEMEQEGIDKNLAIGIGALQVKLEELTNAYATFVAGGRRAPTLIVSKIGEAEQPHETPVQAITPEIAYLATSIMESVIDEGTAAGAKNKIKRPAAGKTGTTNRDHDAWFVGYTPDIVVGVWVGFDDQRDLGRGEQGARSALPIWVDVINGALKGVAPRPFAQPPGIVIARIDPATGLLAPPGSTHAIDEKFLQGTAPTQMAPEQGTANPDTFVIDQPTQ